MSEPLDLSGKSCGEIAALNTTPFKMKKLTIPVIDVLQNIDNYFRNIFKSQADQNRKGDDINAGDDLSTKEVNPRKRSRFNSHPLLSIAPSRKDGEKSVYRCKKCPTTRFFKKISGLRRHITKYHPIERINSDHSYTKFPAYVDKFKRNPIYWVYCDKPFSSENDLLGHAKLHSHGKRSVWEHAYYSGPVSLLSHTVDSTNDHHTVSEDSNYQSDDTPKQDDDLNPGHLPTMEDVFICIHCNQPFNSLPLVKKHLARIWCTERSLLRCPVCKISFPCQPTLSFHICVDGKRNTHPEKDVDLENTPLASSPEPSFTGNHCYKAYKSKPLLKQHYFQVVHTERPLVECPSCLKLYRSKWYVNYNHKKHCHSASNVASRTSKTNEKTMRDHTNNDDNSLESKAVEELPLEEEEEEEEDAYKNRIQCFVCSKMFLRVENLLTHHQIAHGVSGDQNDEPKKNQPKSVCPPEEKFVCDHCYKAFKSKPAVRQHIEGVHMKVWLFKCRLCLKPFPSKQRILTHLANTHGIKQTNRGPKHNL